MHFEKDHLYHIFNRGNNSQRIVYNRNNYFFLLQKIKQYILPYADVLAWCLLPNHFHLMVYINHVELSIATTDSLTSSEAISSRSPVKTRTLNDSIGIMLRTYTRAIHKQENTSGPLFQKHTKAICLTEINGISKSWFKHEYGTLINIPEADKEYPNVCFNYIHQNPVLHKLSSNVEEWEFSSAQDYYTNRKGKLINKEKAKEFGMI